jgi:hypothetical protein
VPTLPDGGDTGGGDGGDGGGGGGGGGDVEALADSIFNATPAGLDREESACMADVIVSVIGEGDVAAAGGDVVEVYQGTSSSEDEQIASGFYTCTDVEDDEALAEAASNGEWPEAWVPTSG